VQERQDPGRDSCPGGVRTLISSVSLDQSRPPEPTTAVVQCDECGSARCADRLWGLCPRRLLDGARATLEPQGERVGDYVLGEVIGCGGMGEIFQATHIETEVAVAIKFARPELLAAADGVALFRNEINTMSRLSHPNIARIFPSAWHDPRPYFVMELLDGGTLEDPRNHRRYRSPRGAAKLVSTLSGAVQCAHSHGVLHCDIKPANILFDLEGEPHVADFGLGRLIDDTCPTIQALMNWSDLTRAPRALTRHQGRFDNVFLFSRDGAFQARSPLPDRYKGTNNYRFRDYHRCATALGEQLLARGAAGASPPVCVSRVFRSTTDAQLKFSLAAPLIRQGELVGVATGSIQARDRFAGLEMRCGPGQCTTGLIGSRDRDDPQSPLPGAALVVFAHPSLKLPWVNPIDSRDERRLDAATVTRICSRLRCTPDRENPFGDPEAGPIVLDDFEEPVTRQRSVVALAPVGRTGLITMVSTPDAAMEEIRLGLQWRAWMFVWIPLLAGVTLLASVLVFPQILRVLARRRQRPGSIDA
jgi:serine/threonine protein kinase